MSNDEQGRLQSYARMIEGLHANWTPHTGQIPIGKALITEGKKDIFVQAGRNFGKTDLVAYLLWRWAIQNPGSENYYFAPYMKQAREILWASRRVQSFGPKDWLAGNPNNTEMRISFANGSFVKLDGSDNVEAYRGVKPKGLSVFDEFKDFRPEFYEAFDPNRAAHDTPLIMIGTPPDRECQFTAISDEFRKNPLKAYFEAPTYLNPHIPKAWLEKKKAELYARGEGEVWEREYMARFVKGGASKIFPMLDRSVVRPHEGVMRELHRDRKKLRWIFWCDPAAASCFAVLFVAINPYTKRIYLLDEIYETDQKSMSVRQIGTRVFRKREELEDRAEWRQGYDEAATWFASECLDHFGEYLEPSRKASNDKEAGLSLIKDILLSSLIVVSDRCTKAFWEMDNYFKDKNGKIPKKDDHLIDCLRYLLASEGYSLNEEFEYVEAKDENFRGRTIEQDLEADRSVTDQNWEDWN